MTEIELMLALLVGMLALVVVARRIGIAYPILLVVAGLILAAIPVWPEIDLPPELVFTIFLPPILFSAAYETSWRDFRRQIVPISFLAIGLVLATMVGIAIVAHALIPGLSWAAAFVLGAIVSPPDAVATVAIVNRLGVPRRIVTVLEGESLVNDATALVAYRFAVAAVVTDAFSLWQAGFDFFLDAAGGMLVGYIVGRIAIWAVPRLGDQGAVAITFIAAIASYVLGESFELSGVLATIVTGLIFGRYLPIVGSAQIRLQTSAIWDLVVFVINGVVFILIGLQLRPVIERITQWSDRELVWYAVVICTVAILIRVLWVFAATYGLRYLGPLVHVPRAAPSNRTALVVGWAGLRGVVTLATALALPRVTNDGTPFNERELIIFLAFAVIVVTLLGQGLTLGPLVERLRLASDDTGEREETLARREAIQAALGHLDRLTAEPWVPQDTATLLRGRYERRLKRLPAVDGARDSPARPDRHSAQLRLNREVCAAARDAIIALRNHGEISDEVLQAVSRELDLDETRPIL